MRFGEPGVDAEKERGLHDAVCAHERSDDPYCRTSVGAAATDVGWLPGKVAAEDHAGLHALRLKEPDQVRTRERSVRTEQYLEPKPAWIRPWLRKWQLEDLFVVLEDLVEERPVPPTKPVELW
jgi:hypothetical protein